MNVSQTVSRYFQRVFMLKKREPRTGHDRVLVTMNISNSKLFFVPNFVPGRKTNFPWFVFSKRSMKVRINFVGVWFIAFSLFLIARETRDYENDGRLRFQFSNAQAFYKARTWLIAILFCACRKVSRNC